MAQNKQHGRRQDDQEMAEKLSLESAFACQGESKTLQGPAVEADINYIVKTYGLSTREVPPEVLDPRYYGDLTDVPDLQTALDRVRDANDHFQRLPALLRRRFNDNPAVLWDFVNDPTNHPEAVKLGLLKEVPQIAETPPQPPVAST